MDYILRPLFCFASCIVFGISVAQLRLRTNSVGTLASRDQPAGDGGHCDDAPGALTVAQSRAAGGNVKWPAAMMSICTLSLTRRMNVLGFFTPHSV
jgi:hypothetical protein